MGRAPGDDDDENNMRQRWLEKLGMCYLHPRYEVLLNNSLIYRPVMIFRFFCFEYFYRFFVMVFS